MRHAAIVILFAVALVGAVGIVVFTQEPAPQTAAWSRPASPASGATPGSTDPPAETNATADGEWNTGTSGGGDA